MAVCVQRQQLQEAVHAQGGETRAKPAELARHEQMLEAAEMRVEVRLFRDIAEALLEGKPVAVDPLAAEQDFAGARLEADGVDGWDAAEMFGDGAQFEHSPYPM